MKRTTIKRMLSALAVVAALAGCATSQPTYTALAFDEAEYAALAKEGTGVVRGQVFAKTRGGDIKKGAGNNVVMMPATKFGDQRYYEHLIAGKLLSTSEDRRHHGYMKTKTTDGEGRFEFIDVPPGKYYVFSDVTWEVPSTNPYMRGMMETQGGRVIGKFEVKNGAVTDAVLSR